MHQKHSAAVTVPVAAAFIFRLLGGCVWYWCLPPARRLCSLRVRFSLARRLVLGALIITLCGAPLLVFSIADCADFATRGRGKYKKQPSGDALHRVSALRAAFSLLLIPSVLFFVTPSLRRADWYPRGCRRCSRRLFFRCARLSPRQGARASRRGA